MVTVEEKTKIHGGWGRTSVFSENIVTSFYMFPVDVSEHKIKVVTWVGW